MKLTPDLLIQTDALIKMTLQCPDCVCVLQSGRMGYLNPYPTEPSKTPPSYIYPASTKVLHRCHKNHNLRSKTCMPHYTTLLPWFVWSVSSNAEARGLYLYTTDHNEPPLSTQLCDTSDYCHVVSGGLAHK